MSQGHICTLVSLTLLVGFTGWNEITGTAVSFVHSFGLLPGQCKAPRLHPMRSEAGCIVNVDAVTRCSPLAGYPVQWSMITPVEGFHNSSQPAACALLLDPSLLLQIPLPATCLVRDYLERMPRRLDASCPDYPDRFDACHCSTTLQATLKVGLDCRSLVVW